MSARREFDAATKREIRERSGGVCECHRMPADIAHMFPKHCDRPAVDIDHVYADTLESDKSGDLTDADGAHLCKPCHKIKSASDQAMRRKRNAHTVRKGRPKPGWFQQGAKIPKGRGFQTNRDSQFKAKIGGGVERRS